MNRAKREELKRKIAANQNPVVAPALKSIDKAIDAGDAALKALDVEEARQIAENVKGGSIIVVRESITHTCGHKVGVAQLESIACTGCIAKNRQERLARKNAAKAKRIEAVPVDSFRLPDGSVYTKRYSANTKTWSASLCVLIDGNSKTFTASGPASFKVECDLDRMYREAVKDANRAAEIEEARNAKA